MVTLDQLNLLHGCLIVHIVQTNHVLLSNKAVLWLALGTKNTQYPYMTGKSGESAYLAISQVPNNMPTIFLKLTK